jgi:membrane-anchored mycosin MYCP
MASRVRTLVVAATVAVTSPGPALPARAAPAMACSLPPTRLVTAQPWAQRRLAFEQVWPITRGAGIVVAVVDTGVDARQPLFGGHVLPGIDVANGGGARGSTASATGPSSPASSPPSTATGRLRRRGAGCDDPAGAAVELGHRRHCRHAGRRDRGRRRRRREGDQPVGDGCTTTPALSAAVRHALDRDVVVVAAAGNDFQQGNAVQYPASYPGVISVGAIGTDGRRADFSETNTAISVVAPGVDLIGPGAGGTGMVVGERGTSFSAPFVSGVAALIRAYRPMLSAAQVKHRIEATADHPAGALPDRQLGFGVVNPYRAVTEELPEEQQAVSGPTRPPVPLPMAATPGDHGPRDRALLGASALALAALLVAAGAATVRAGYRRRWRPGLPVR